MDSFPVSNQTLRNLHRDAVVSAISSAVIESATNGDDNHTTYIKRKILMSYSHTILKYILDKIRANFPESSVYLKVESRGQQRDITLSELSLVLATCSLNEEARVGIHVDWSTNRVVKSKE